MKKRTKQKNNTTNQKKKTVSALKLFREMFVWHRELAVFRTMSWLSAIDICLQRASGFRLPQRAASSMAAALWKLQTSITRIQNTHVANSTSLPSLAQLICFLRGYSSIGKLIWLALLGTLPLSHILEGFQFAFFCFLICRVEVEARSI